MELPEARGITFYQFIRERWSAWRRVNATISSQPQFTGCRNNVLSLFSVNVHSAANFVYASLVLASHLAQAFLYWQEQRPDAVLPALQPIQWFQAPDAFWNYFSAAYWRALVSQGELAGSCGLGPVNFSSILGEGG